jgi:2-polyprenyl-6-methoxyphenol hydroxylase-like FAD-dependent oxidoreductase
MKITIAGAGIGGLALALMLHKRGIEVEIWEAVQDIKPLGVGINLLPHAVKELAELGLEGTLAEIGIKTSQLAYYNRHGQQIWIEARGRAAGYEWPQFSIHRGALQVALLRAASERLGPQRVHLGHAFESFEQDGQGVVARMRRRSDDTLVETRSSMLAGADGMHSALRRLLHPAGDEPRFSGRMLWRAITESQPFMDGRSMFMAGHQDQKFVAYPISEPLRRQGRSLINWIAELRVPDGAPPATDWNKRVDKSVFAPAFADWKWDWIDIPALIDSAATIYEFPLVDRDPLPRWTVGRVTLLGDAAHPMYPIGSNGSAQAILDARYLADCIADCAARGGDLLYALKEYEAERLPRTAGIVLRNRLNGPEQVMQIAEERAPDGFTNIDDVIPFAERDEISQRYKRLAGFDRQSLAAPATR